MNPTTSLKVTAVTALLLIHGATFASPACEAPVCKSVEECRQKATWEIEATILDLIREKPGHGCIDGPGEPYCGQTDPHPTYLLEDVVVKKGEFDVSGKNRSVISRHGICSIPFPSASEPLKISKRYRLFGSWGYGFIFADLQE